jgi:hypothetical protein
VNETITNDLPAVITRDIPDLPKDPAVLIAERDAKIAELEAALEAQTNRQRPIELKDGEATTHKAVDITLDELKVEAELAELQSKRYRAQLSLETERATLPADQKPLLTKETAIELIGLARWSALPTKAKAQMLDERKSDLDAVDLAAHFGAKSNSRLAHELGRDRPGLYKLARAKAVKAGLIG